MQSGQDVMGAVYICFECREFILERVAYIALSGQVIALVWLNTLKYLAEARVALERGRVNF